MTSVHSSAAPKVTPHNAEEPAHARDPSVVMRQHLVDRFDAEARRAGIEVAQPGVTSYSANTMFHVRPARGPHMLAKVLAAARAQPQELAAFAHEQAGCLLAARVGVGAAVLHREPRMLLTSYIEGSNLQGGKPVAWQPTRRALRQLRKLHLAPLAPQAPEACTLLSKYQRAAADTLALGLIEPARAKELDSQAGLAHELLQRLGAGTTTLVHGDFHPGNVRIDFDGQATLIDLERWGRGEPTADLAHFATGAHLNLRDMRRLLRAYGGQGTPHLLPRLRLSMFLVHAQHSMLWRKWNHTEDWCKRAEWGPAKVRQTDALLERGLRHVQRYGRRPARCWSAA